MKIRNSLAEVQALLKPILFHLNSFAIKNKLFRCYVKSFLNAYF